VSIIEKRNIAYEMVCEFLNALNKSDFGLLNRKFGISDAVYKEIQEIVVQGYFTDFGESLNLSPPPLDIAFIHKGSRVPFKVYEMNQENAWGIECLLWNNGEKSEPTAHFDLFKEGENFRLGYRYTGS
jgi:hypothetical protein